MLSYHVFSLRPLKFKIQNFTSKKTGFAVSSRDQPNRIWETSWSVKQAGL